MDDGQAEEVVVGRGGGEGGGERGGWHAAEHPLRPLAWSSVGRRAFRYARTAWCLDIQAWRPQAGTVPEPWEVATGPYSGVSLAMFLRSWNPSVMSDPRHLGVTALLRHPCPPRRSQPRTRPPAYCEAALLAACSLKPDRIDASGSAGGGTGDTGLVPVPLRDPRRLSVTVAGRGTGTGTGTNSGRRSNGKGRGREGALRSDGSDAL